MRLKSRIKFLAHTYCPGLRGWFRYFDTRVYFPKGSWIFELACEQGIYESQLLTLIQGLAKPATWYFDVGANIGLMSVPILCQRHDVNVLSFEPSPNSAPYIRRTHAESAWTNRWRILAKAVGRHRGTADFSYGSEVLAGYDGLRHTGRVEKRGTLPIEVTTLDDEWMDLGCPPVSFMKLDIEGAEIEALEGATRILGECRPFIIVEWYADNLAPYDIKPVALLEIARRFAYEVVCIPTMTVLTGVSLLQALMVQTSAFILVPPPAPVTT